MTRTLAALAVACFIAAAGLPACAHGPDPKPGGDEPRQCGGIAGLQCEHDTDFCMMEAGTCQVADNMGVCTPRPEVCTKEYRPVCGCDGTTYGNKCDAMAHGVSIDHTGACADEEEKPDRQ